MSVRQGVINLLVNINGDEAQNQLNELRKRAADLIFETKNNSKNLAEDYIAAAADVKKINADMVSLKQQIGIIAFSEKELISELNRLEALKDSISPLTLEHKKLIVQIKAVNSRLNYVRNGIAGIGSVFLKTNDSAKPLGIFAACILGFRFIISMPSKRK